HRPRDAFLARGLQLQPRTETTIRSVTVLRRQLQAAREEGVAWSMGEFTVGIVGIALPVLDAHGRAIAAVGVALPAERLDEVRKAKILHALRNAARGIADAVATASTLPADGK
ncbi:MAG: hypothetical protein EOO24_37085, partial [Comamonadaceae bacterium]